MGTSDDNPVAPITIDVTDFDDHPHRDDYPGARGVMIDAHRDPTEPHVYASSFPTVRVFDSGDVEIDDVGRWPAEEVRAWIEAIHRYVATDGPGRR